MRFACTHCSGINEVENQDMGTAVHCAHCEKVIVVPEEMVTPGVLINNDFILNNLLYTHPGLHVRRVCKRK